MLVTNWETKLQRIMRYIRVESISLGPLKVVPRREAHCSEVVGKDALGHKG